MSTQPLQPFIVSAATPDFSFLGVPSNWLAREGQTNGAFMLIENRDMPKGFASPYHRHHDEDECFYVLKGEMAFVVEGQWMKAPAGTFVFGPRGLSHGFVVTSEAPASMLLMCAPGKFDRFVETLADPAGTPPAPPDMAKMMAAAAAAHIEIYGPLPSLPAGW